MNRSLDRKERLLRSKLKRKEAAEQQVPSSGVETHPVLPEPFSQSGLEEHLVAEEEELFTSKAESDIEEEQQDDIQGSRIVFKPAAKRHTLEERKVLSDAALELDEALQKKQDERMMDSKNLVKHLVVLEETEESKRMLKPKGSLLGEENATMPDDNDDTDPDTDRLAWESREIERILRDINDREQVVRDAEEIERRRGLTDQQRAIEDAAIEAAKPKVEKGPHKYQYMQKWYHKGAFFQDDAQDNVESIYLRDFQQPTAADLQNREELPSAMKLRRGQFGMKGATKYTHLRDQDTTDTTSAMYKVQGKRSGGNRDDSEHTKRRQTDSGRR